MADHPTSIRLPHELKSTLKKAAEAKKWPLAVLIVEVLKQWCAWQKKQEGK